MGYCGPLGIPLSTFLGWSQDDQDAALAWKAHEGRRSADGTHPDDWDPEQGGSRAAWHAHVDVLPGAVELQRAQASEEARERGAVVRLVRGSAGECDRCTADRGLPGDAPDEHEHEHEHDHEHDDPPPGG